MCTGSFMKKVLVAVVEDNQFFRESMRRLVRSLGYTVDVFSSAAEFLASPRLNETACLISDVHMPAMTGLELNRHLIEAGHPIPTVLLTAFPNEADRAHALRDGIVCYLGKPANEQQLVGCLSVALASGEPPAEGS
jgi:FixJ family two-component response regulator